MHETVKKNMVVFMARWLESQYVFPARIMVRWMMSDMLTDFRRSNLIQHGPTWLSHSWLSQKKWMKPICFWFCTPEKSAKVGFWIKELHGHINVDAQKLIQHTEAMAHLARRWIPLKNGESVQFADCDRLPEDLYVSGYYITITWFFS